MFKTRSNLLIALVLFGALGAATAVAHADSFKHSASPGEPVSGEAYQPGSSPDAGEPDNPNGSRLAMSYGGRGSEPVVGAEPRTLASLAETLRWAWVIWLARYLSPNL